MPRSDQLRNDQRILQAAARLLAVNPDATVQAIADAAGVTRLTVYRRYPNREAMASSLHAAVKADAMAILDGFPGWDDGVAAFRMLVTELAALVRRYPIVLTGPRRPHDAGPSAVDRRLDELLAAGQASGFLRADVSPGSLNSVIFGALTTLAPRPPGTDGSQPIDDVISILLDGITGHSDRAAHR